MILGKLMNNTKTRRKGSMLEDTLSKFKYIFMLAVLLILPMQAKAQQLPVIDQTDTGSNRLVAFWDTRGRDSFIQVTNTSDQKINIHVQVYDVGSGVIECEECNFDDMLTPNDTHVYNVKDMMTNGIPSLLIPSVAKCTEIGSDTYGFAVISFSGGGIGPPPGSEIIVKPKVLNPLIGMFRIIDENGYEYRANAAGEDYFADYAATDVVNFNDANGNNLSDLVGITYASINPSFVYASPGVITKFGSVQREIFIVDEFEDPTSCSPTTFSCAVGNMDKGIDNSLPNSLGQNNRLCPTSTLDTNSSGYVVLPFDQFICTDPEVTDPITGQCIYRMEFVGFIGLNNGDGTGSMDSFWTRDDGPGMKKEAVELSK